ncbi:hypothetical protein ACI3KX_00460 [Microbacterium sp. ZW CA_36]|uniref:hypothetical protein n=1 Tax=Microbacterium sp. ZW CA_36 TaxID=3378078 RepID=UPI0038544526
MHTEYSDEHGRLEPGVRRVVQHNSSTPKFELIATMEQLQPESWRAEVTLFGHTILKVDGVFPSKHAAGNAAETALRVHLVRLFST